jgi:hypothetical protein
MRKKLYGLALLVQLQGQNFPQVKAKIKIGPSLLLYPNRVSGMVYNLNLFAPTLLP